MRILRWLDAQVMWQVENFSNTSFGRRAYRWDRLAPIIVVMHFHKFMCYWHTFVAWTMRTPVLNMIYIPLNVYTAFSYIPKLKRVGNKEGISLGKMLEIFPEHLDKWAELNVYPQQVLQMWEDLGLKRTNQFHRVLTNAHTFTSVADVTRQLDAIFHDTEATVSVSVGVA